MQMKCIMYEMKWEDGFLLIKKKKRLRNGLDDTRRLTKKTDLNAASMFSMPKPKMAKFWKPETESIK